jgi:hypothetical protein
MSEGIENIPAKVRFTKELVGRANINKYRGLKAAGEHSKLIPPPTLQDVNPLLLDGYSERQIPFPDGRRLFFPVTTIIFPVF